MRDLFFAAVSGGAFWESGLGVAIGVVLFVLAFVSAVLWFLVPFWVHGLLQEVKAVRKVMAEVRLEQASLQAAQLGQLKAISAALNGATITAVEEPVEAAAAVRPSVIAPGRVRLFNGR